MTHVMHELIYVRSKTGKPLMPTRRQHKVWYWLRKGLAEVVSREPFTVRLKFETNEYTQPATVGVDTGSQTVGVAAITNGEVVYQAEVHLRTDITHKLTQRRQYRRKRRQRKTRYRAPRFHNRRRKTDWLPPSLRSKAETTIKAVCFVALLLPVRQVNVEVGSFDTQKIQKPEISGSEYQQGALQGYHLREYLLAKWNRTCAYCGTQGIPLQVEHIIPKARGGTDRAVNLTLACDACNKRKGTQTAAEFGYPDIQAQARVPLTNATHISSIKTRVVQALTEQFGQDRVTITYGYETKFKRLQALGLPKGHANDAVAIACALGETVTPLSRVYQIRCLPRGNYQRYNGKRSEHCVWAPKKVRGWKLYELVQAKGQIGYIGGRRIKGAFVVKDVITGKTLLEITPRKLERITRPLHGWILVCLPLQGKEERASSPA